MATVMRDIYFSKQALDGKIEADGRKASMELSLRESQLDDSLTQLHERLVTERNALHLRVLTEEPAGFVAEEYRAWEEAKVDAPGVSEPDLFSFAEMVANGLPSDVGYHLAESWFINFEKGLLKPKDLLKNRRVEKANNEFADGRFSYVQLPSGGGWHAHPHIAAELGNYMVSFGKGNDAKNTKHFPIVPLFELGASPAFHNPSA